MTVILLQLPEHFRIICYLNLEWVKAQTREGQICVYL